LLNEYYEKINKIKNTGLLKKIQLIRNNNPKLLFLCIFSKNKS